MVYAVDIHELALVHVRRKIERYDLKYVAPILAPGYRADVSDAVAGVALALE